MLNHPFFQLLMRWAVSALGVLLAATIIPGISYTDGLSLFIVVVLLSFFNAFLKPVLVLFTLPFVILTMGFGILFINALLFLLSAHFVEGFVVAGFGSAFFGALIVSLTSLFLGGAFKGGSGGGGRGPRKPRDHNVIDI
ncbi:MAG: phage holin family protein [Opitutaceae bacterium]|nr:phage holin family protein [Opitutaceae bacterium]